MSARAARVRLGYSPELDGLRGMAIGLVIIWHYLVGSTPLESDSIWAPVWRVLGATWSGVDLFFVLSGYLIGGILEDNRRSRNFFQVFYWRRACRILPIYVLGLVAVVGIPSLFSERLAGTALLKEPLPGWSYLLFVQNWFMAIRGTLGGWGVTWSLAVEEQFYLALPFLVRFGRKALVPLLVLGSLSAPLVRFLSPNHVFAYVVPIARCDSLFLGVLLAVLVRKHPDAAFRLGSFRGLVPVSFGACLLSTIIEPAWEEEPMRTVGISVFAMAYAALLLRSQVVQTGFLKRVLLNRGLGWLGRRAYFVYLAHGTVQIVFHAILLKQWPRNNGPLGFLATLASLAATLLAAEASWRLIESPAIRAGQRVGYDPPGGGRQREIEPR